MADKFISAEEFLQRTAQRKRYLIQQYKKTNDKKFYHRLDELRRAESYAAACAAYNAEIGDKSYQIKFKEHSVILAPTVEAESVRHGRWKGKPIAGYSTVKCSECGYVFMENSGKWNYCPNCGAKMDEEENDASI